MASTAETSPVTTQDVTFASADGASTIHARIWWPAGIAAAGEGECDGEKTAAPVGVVQLVHGMSEHIRRYDDFARYLCDLGWVVCGDDHIGHGRSAAPGKFGCMPAKGGDAALVADEHTLRGLVQGLVKERTGAEVPHVIFGHSMGSFITRVYLSQHADGLAAAVICGTGTIPVATSKAGHAAARLVAAVRGQDFVSKLLDSLGSGAYSKAVPGPTGLEWLSHNKQNVADYIDDKECGFMFSAGGYCALTALTAKACSKECAAAVPHDLPLLYIAGDGDPVGDMGEGVKAAAHLATDAGSTDVTCKIFPEMRHEILNEAGKMQVYEAVSDWLERKVCHEHREVRDRA